MLARLSAFTIWALVAATAVFWGLRLWVRAPAAPAYAVAVDGAGAARGDLTRLLGAAPVTTAAATAVTAPEAASRFRLLGIMAPKRAAGATSAAQGVALIAVDGKMPKAFSVGARIDGDLVLQSVSLRTVSIAADRGGAQAIMLELPPPNAAATGTLPSGGGFAAPTLAVPVPTHVTAPVPPAAAAPPVAPPQGAPPPGTPTPSSPVPPRPEPNPRVP